MKKTVKNAMIITGFLFLEVATTILLVCKLIPPWNTPGNAPGVGGSEWFLWYETFWLFEIPIIVAETDICLDILYFASPSNRHKRHKSIANVVGAVLAAFVIVFSLILIFDLVPEFFKFKTVEFVWLGSILLYILWRFGCLIVSGINHSRKDISTTP